MDIGEIQVNDGVLSGWVQGLRVICIPTFNATSQAQLLIISKFFSLDLLKFCFFLGSQDGGISVWDIKTPTPAFASIDIRPLKQLESHTKPSQVVKFNPRYLMMVSGCTDLVSVDVRNDGSDRVC
jgi:hypothetical protein